MKKIRQKKILEIIENNKVSTQEQLRDYLIEADFDVTQATVSRDVKEMKLSKIRDKAGDTRYAAPSPEKSPENIMSNSIIHVDSAANIVAVKCRSGMASAVCAEIDSMHYPNIVGTIAGDDTIFILFRNYMFAEEFKNNYGKE